MTTPPGSPTPTRTPPGRETLIRYVAAALSAGIAALYLSLFGLVRHAEAQPGAVVTDSTYGYYLTLALPYLVGFVLLVVSTRVVSIRRVVWVLGALTQLVIVVLFVVFGAGAVGTGVFAYEALNGLPMGLLAALVTGGQVLLLGLLGYLSLRPGSPGTTGERDLPSPAAAENAAGEFAAGWYPNPYGYTEHRYWDGTAWTDQTRPLRPEQARPSVPADAAATEPTTEPPSARTNAVAIAALVSTLLIPVLYFVNVFAAFLAAILSVVLGHTARSQIKHTGAKGEYLALTAVMIGWAVLALVLLFIVLLALLLRALSGLG